MSLRDQILQADDLERQEVEVPEWGVSVWVRGLTSAERDDYESELLEITEDGDKVLHRENARAKLLVRAVVDEDGNRVFGDEDVEALGEKSGRATDRLFDVAQELSGVTEEDVEELAGNSPGGPGEGSPSD